MSKPCIVCGNTSEDYCGYHFVGPHKVSMCVACGENPTKVYVLRIDEHGTGVYSDNYNDILDCLASGLNDAEVGDTYFIEVGGVTNLQKYTMPEFDGF